MGQSVTELYGARTEGLGLDQLQQVIENLAKREAESRKRAPNELLRVVKNGEVVWMTAEEADELLKPSGEDEDRTRALVERALKGETKVLVLELRTMIAIAVSMLDEYKRQGSLVVNEADRIRPLLIQSERRVNTTYRELREIEGRVEDYRKSNPIFGEFENKMGLLLNLQRTGKNEEAAKVAAELARMRGKYLQFSRGMVSDMNVIYGHRYDLQKIKGSVLSHQRYVAVQREGALQEQIQEDRDKLKMLCKGRPVEEARQGEFGSSVVECERQLRNKKSELKAVSKGVKVIEILQKDVESVISQIAQHIIREKPEADKREKPEKAEPADKPQPETTPQKSVRRMATANRRR